MRPKRTVALTAFCALLSAVAAAGQESALRIIADTDTPVPGGSGQTFQTFFQLDGVDPDISGRNVVFMACCATGIYGWFNGDLMVIANLDSTFPGTGNPMGFFTKTSPSIDGRNVAFACSDGRPGQGAVCAWIDGKLEAVVKGAETLIPGTSQTFAGLGFLDGVSPSISGRNVAFFGNSLNGARAGIYARIDGQLITIADNTTEVPGHPGKIFGNFGQLRGWSPAISGGNVAFYGRWDDGNGLFAYLDGKLRVIADDTTQFPDGSFVGVLPPEGAAPSIDGENIAFTTGRGVIGYINGSLSVIADRNTPIPGGDGTFGGPATGPVISGQYVTVGGGAPGLGGGAIFVFGESGAQLIAVENSTPVPGHEQDTFDLFQLLDRPSGSGEGVRPSISGKNVVFFGSAVEPNQHHVAGIYGRIVDPVEAIPATSPWWLIVLASLVLAAGAVFVRRRINGREAFPADAAVASADPQTLHQKENER